MSRSGPTPEPSPEWIAGEVLGIGLRQLYGRTVARCRPIYKSRVQDLGANVFVEVLLLPSLQMVLRVRDDDTGEVLAQSEPDNFNAVDLHAPKAAQQFRDWQAARAAVANRVDRPSINPT